MKPQSINLYQNRLKKTKWDLSFHNLLLVSTVAFLLFTGVTLIDSVNYFYTKHQVNKLKDEQTGKSLALQKISEKVPKVQTRDELINQIKKYTAQKDAKESVINLLASQFNQTGHFSIYLEALSQKTVTGLWFTKLNFNDSGNNILLEGKTLEAENVPALITALSQDPAFEGKKFSIFKESLDEKTQNINFILQTKLEEKQ